MSIDFENLKDVIWEALTDRFVTAENVVGVWIFEDQAAKRPESGKYGTLKIISGPTAQGLDEERFFDEGAEYKSETLAQSELTLSLQVFRSGANTALSKVRSALRGRTFQEALQVLAKAKNLDVVLVDVLGMQDLTALLQSDYEERAQVDVLLRVVDSHVETAGNIEHVTATGEIYNVDDTLAATINLDVEKP